MQAYLEGRSAKGLYGGQAPSPAPPRLAFLFSGQGSQYLHMGRQLYLAQPAFRAAFERCREGLRGHLEGDLAELLYGEQASEAALRQTALLQPALFALEYALAQMWQSWGVVPSLVVGHSLGEYVAACVAGVFSPEDGLRLVARRGRLMQELCEPGAMAAVEADLGRVEEAISGYGGEVAGGAINGAEDR